MPAVSQRGSRRRTINEINMVPFIDVMLVLLIIFMVSAPLITTGVIDVPSVGKAKQQPEHVLEVILEGKDQITLRLDGQEQSRQFTAKTVAKEVNELLKNISSDTPVIIAAQKDIPYDAVVHVMDQLQRAGVQRVGLSVKTTGQ